MGRVHFRGQILGAIALVLSLLLLACPGLVAPPDDDDDDQEQFEWELVGLESEEILAIATDPVNANVVYAVGIYGTPYNATLFKTTDGGSTWDTLQAKSFVNELKIDPHTPTALYLAGYINGISGAALLKSIDGGLSWTDSDSGINHGLYGVEVCFAFDPLQPGIMYAGTEGHDWCGLYKSSDAGKLWTPLSEDNSRLDGIEAVVVDPIEPDRLYVVVFSGVYALKSNDQGLSWETMEFQEHTSQMLKDIFIHPSGHDTLFASSWYEGAYRSTDYGDTWTVIADSIIGTGRIREFAYYDGDIYAAVYDVNGPNHGVYVFSAQCNCFRLAGGLVSNWADSEVHTIAVTRDNRLLAGTGSGIWEYVEVPE